MHKVILDLGKVLHSVKLLIVKKFWKSKEDLIMLNKYIDVDKLSQKGIKVANERSWVRTLRPDITLLYMFSFIQFVQIAYMLTYQTPMTGDLLLLIQNEKARGVVQPLFWA